MSTSMTFARVSYVGGAHGEDGGGRIVPLLLIILVLLLIGGGGLLVFVVKSFVAAGIVGIILLGLLIYMLVGRGRSTA